MTLYLNFRSKAVGGSVIDPYALEGDGTVQPAALRAVTGAQIAIAARGKDILLVAHGFNVSYQWGASSLAWLDRNLQLLSSSELFVGLLWPGDFWLPAVNYPFEGATSMDCGRRLAAYCNKYLTGVRSISFASHSLGARLVLETIRNLDRSKRSVPVRTVCLTAGAINGDCLTREYAAAAPAIRSIATLASHEDFVLKLAFPAGDLIADALHLDHTPLTPALGYDGPRPIDVLAVAPFQIPDEANYGHGDYLPPAGANAPNALDKWGAVSNFILRVFRDERPVWP